MYRHVLRFAELYIDVDIFVMKLVTNERIINHVVDQLINNGVEQ